MMKLIYIILLTLVCSVGFTYILMECYKSSHDCVLDQPRVLVSGYIRHVSGGFLSGSSAPVYRLLYKGTKSTGEYCEIDVSVTERKYERVIYGYENE